MNRLNFVLIVALGLLIATPMTGSAQQSQCVESCQNQGLTGQALGECVSNCAQGGCRHEDQNTFCGGIAGVSYPTGLTCIDDPRDGCDPAAGGADCNGICVCE